jgi:hypothetical protein
LETLSTRMSAMDSEITRFTGWFQSAYDEIDE